MMGFDSATSSFLALLVNHKEKTAKGKIKNKSFQLRRKKSKTNFGLEIKPSPRHKKFRWPVMVVKLRKRQKLWKILETIANFNKTLLKFKILISRTIKNLKIRIFFLNFIQKLLKLE